MKLPVFPVHTLGRLYCRMVSKGEYRKQDKTRINERAVELRFVFEHLSQACPSTVLDVGTGKSSLPHLMSLCGYEVTAVDNVDDYWRKGVFNRHFWVMKDDITHTGLDKTFDFITCVSVLEHIRDHEAAVASMVSRLKPGGRLVLTCPYNESTYVENVYKLPGAGYGQNFPYICQVYSRNEVNSWLEKNPCRIIKQEYWRFFTGEFWTFGNQVCPPEEVNREDIHHITCLLIERDDT